MTEIPGNKSAWVQLYEARRPVGTVTIRTPGRPPSSVPRHKVGVTLSQGETAELEGWQERFSNLLGRKVSLGETIGILTRICSTRLNALGSSSAATASKTPAALDELVELMIG
jgi:hypothetical protein